VSRVAIVTGSASGIGLATVRRLEVLDIAVTSFDLQGNEGHVGDKVGQCRKVHASQKRGNGAVKLLAVIPALS
jgi:NAD(P)-dependent dehydrogenase (short-subunit alcohol dehydrogenase family)